MLSRCRAAQHLLGLMASRYNLAPAAVKLPMPKTSQNPPAATPNRPPFECITLLLQGGGALGAFQAGVYEAMAEAGVQPDWVAGISIGAINAAIIAGNAPSARVGKLREFWEEITARPGWDWFADS